MTGFVPHSPVPGEEAAGPRGWRPGLAVEVAVPASSANLGPGFDAIGLALGRRDRYTVAVTAEPCLRIEFDGDSQGVPTDETNLVYAAMARAWQVLGATAPAGLTLRCGSGIPQGRGMGSSAAAIVAGVAAAQGLWMLAGLPDAGEAGGVLPLDRAWINDLAAALEGHPDNSSASLYGGLTVSWVDHPSGAVERVSPGGEPDPAAAALRRVESVVVPTHEDLDVVLVLPAGTLSTSTARAALPEQVPHRHAALNSANAALLMLAVTSRPDLLLPATREWLHQEQRREALGGAMELVDELRRRGHAAVVSGAGPSVLVLTRRSRRDAVVALVEQLAGDERTVLTPGIAPEGVQVQRVTLKTPPGGCIEG